MVSPGRITAGNLDYYSDQVAAGAEEYFSGRGVAQATWIGALAPSLGLKGRVNSADFLQVMVGRKPSTEVLLADQFSRRTVLGIDLAFSAPKSVSTLWALAPLEVRKAIEDAHDSALLETFAYIEEHCAYGRKGAAGIHKVRSNGLLASTYHHVTSRESDPQLHTHVAVANMVEFEDGSWGSLDTARLYHYAPTASMIYGQQLRQKLTEVLGVAWDTPRHGLADIKDFPVDLKELFSKRSQQIKEAAEASGNESPWGRQVATLTTRKTKTAGEDHGKLLSDWKDEAAEAGHSWGELSKLCGKTSIAALTAPEFAAIVEQLGTTDYLTQTSAHFDHRQVLAGAVELAGPYVPFSQCQEIAVEVIERHLVSLDRAGEIAGDATRYQKAGTVALTTPEMFAIEQQGIEAVRAGVGESAILLSDQQIQEGLIEFGPSIEIEGYLLGEDQAQMVAHILGSGNTVDAVIGDAGTGKTFSLNVCRAILEAHGYRVAGAALAAAAAKELKDQAQLDGQTIASLLWKIDHQDERFFSNLPDVIVIDEAAMVGTRDTAKLIAFGAEHGVKLVFVGDAKQLPAIAAGGMFSLIDQAIGSVRLTVNRRQRRPEAQEVVAASRDGNIDLSLALSQGQGNLNLSDQHETMIEEILTAWGCDPHPSKMIIAATRNEVQALNSGAQSIRRQRDELGDKALDCGTYRYSVGDEVLCRLNKRRELQVFNGLRARVTKINHRKKQIHLRTVTGEHRVLPFDYVKSPESFQLAYAITTHSAQGSTYENAYVALSALFNKQMFYTAISRAKNRTRLFGTRMPEQARHAGYDPQHDYDPLEEIRRALKRDQSQSAATSVGEADIFGDYANEDLLAALHEHRRRMTDEQAQAVEEAHRYKDAGEAQEYVTNDQVREWANNHPAEAREYRALTDQLKSNLASEAYHATHDRPAWALEVLGDVPAVEAGRAYWRRAYQSVADHRLRQAVTGPTAFGPASKDLAHRRSEKRARAAVDRYKAQIRDLPRSIKGARL